MSTMREADPATLEPEQPPDTFDQFFAREFVRAVKLAWLLTRSSAGAEDIAQDAMVAVHQRFDDLDTPSAYLTRVIVNRCSRWRRDSVVQLRAVQQAAASAPNATGTDEYLLDAIARLPYRQRVVIVARYWCDWSESEIAAALDCRPGTVKSLASRAMSTLRTEFPS
jgi:RNA polymerase sigma factor (sigma-70 family)